MSRFIGNGGLGGVASEAVNQPKPSNTLRLDAGKHTGHSESCVHDSEML
ncbi:hypothetical protein I553_5534 [Mycobacterium xenopi 4042]|uniref:Uncharacterized protein n=1 Tax=Mycobacterium xenopi 4042 TaxID=1299334 RepID=X7ZWA1_MYCXE|nr:hypothetical protein I553_5534 [Mycobacterium xenopi 4042]